MRKGDENMEKKKEPSGIQKAWRRLSIQNQIFLSMFLITLLGVGVLMNIVYKTSIDAIEQNYRASYQSTLKNSSRVMDMNLKNIVDVGRNFLNDEALQQILEKGNEYGGSKFASTDREKLRVIANEMASQQVWVNYIVFTDLSRRFARCRGFAHVSFFVILTIRAHNAVFGKRQSAFLQIFLQIAFRVRVFRKFHVFADEFFRVFVSVAVRAVAVEINRRDHAFHKARFGFLARIVPRVARVHQILYDFQLVRRPFERLATYEFLPFLRHIAGFERDFAVI